MATEYLSVIVKGNRFEAARAAADRGIPFAFCNETDGLTLGHTPFEFWDAVASWFISPPNDPPYPAGTCLHYTVHTVHANA